MKVINPKINIEELSKLYSEGWGLGRLSKHFEVNPNAINNQLKRYDIKDKNRLKPSKIEINEALLKDLYLQGYGRLRLSKKFSCSENVIVKRLTSMGIYDGANRQNKKKPVSRKQNRDRRLEFKTETKKKRFIEENGICQECKKFISDNYRIATYHHILPIAKGGGPEPENCMVLHIECHNDSDIFLRLHGFDLYNSNSYRKLEDKKLVKYKLLPDALRESINEGLTPKQIADKFGINESGLRRRLKRNNLPVNRLK